MLEKTWQRLSKEKTWWAIYMVSMALIAYARRFVMDQDGLSYLDMATQAAAGQYQELVNAYWSPAYPALIAVFLSLFRPDAGAVYPIVHLVNFLIAGLAIAATTFFLRTWCAPLPEEQRQATNVLGYFLFWWLGVEYLGVGHSTPDLLVVVVLLVTAGLVYRMAQSGSGLGGYVLLGLILGAGYYTKAVLFPTALILLLVLLAWPPLKIHRGKVLIAAVVFGISAAPLVFLTSQNVGRLTFGETGKLNYMWYVNGVTRYWLPAWQQQRFSILGDEVSKGQPHAGPRIVMEKPYLTEFDDLPQATYPLWYEPTYWHTVPEIHIDLRQQLAALEPVLEEYLEISVEMGPLFVGLIALGLFMERKHSWKQWRDDMRPFLWQLVWAAGGCAMYAAIDLERRYLAGFFFLGWLALYRLPQVTPGTLRILTLAVCVPMGFPVVSHLVGDAARTAGSLISPQLNEDQRLAEMLRQNGLQSGTKLAYAVQGSDVYFARLAEMRVVAQFPITQQFWDLNDMDMDEVARKLEQIGVQAVVFKQEPVHTAEAAWQSRIQHGQGGSGIVLVRDLLLTQPK